MARNVAWIVAVVLLVSCAKQEVSAPIVNANARPLSLDLLDGLSFIAADWGVQVQLHPMLRDTLGSTLIMPPGLMIVSRDTTVVRVDSVSYLMTAVGVGQTRIVGTLNYGQIKVSDSLTIASFCGAVLAPNFTPKSQSLTVGQSFTAEVHQDDCNQVDVISWSSSDATIVRVDAASGVATAVGVGQAAVRAASARLGALGGIPVTVTP